MIDVLNYGMSAELASMFRGMAESYLNTGSDRVLEVELRKFGFTAKLYPENCVKIFDNNTLILAVYKTDMPIS
jgi:hypothetical protein